MEEINLNSVLKSISSKKWNIIGLFVATLILSTLIIFLTDDKRSIAMTKVLIPGSSLTEQYSSLILDDTILDKVSKEVGITKEKLKNSIEIDNSSKSVYQIGIKVKNSSGELAKKTANELSKEFKDILETKYNVKNASIYSDASVIESYSITIERILNILKKGLIFAIIITLAYIVLIFASKYLKGEYLDSSEIKSIFGIPIMFELCNFYAKYIEKSKRNAFVNDEYKKLSYRIEHKFDKNCNLILFTSTGNIKDVKQVVKNIAAALNDREVKTLVIDLEDKEVKENSINSNKYIFAISPDIISNSNSEKYIHDFKNIIFIDDLEKTNRNKLEEAQKIMELYDVKNVEFIINNKDDNMMKNRYREFANNLKVNK